jgi:lysophospholipase L1-like esterase
MFKVARNLLLSCLTLALASCNSGRFLAPTLNLDGNAASPAALPAVFIGASHTQYWQNYVDFQSMQWIDKGIAGQKCADVLARVQSDVVALHPATMHLLCGTNDILRGPTDPAITEADITQIIFTARANNIDVIMATLPPVRAGVSATFDPTTPQQIIALNDWIRNYAQVHQYPLADYYTALVDGDGQFIAAYTSDGIHANAKGYAVMNSVVIPLFNY